MKGGLFNAKKISFLKKINLKKGLLIVLSLIIVYFIINYFFFRRESMEPNMEFNKNTSVLVNDPDQAKLYFFYADWCPHCTRAKQTGGGWKDFTDRHGDEVRRGNTVISIEEVDCSDDTDPEAKSKINKYKVSGYPTIILDKKGEHYLYDTKPDADRLDEFLDRMI